MCDTFRPVAASCAYAGLRVSEALGLRWRDVDFKAGTLTVAGQLGARWRALVPTKTTASAATLPLLPALRRELARASRPAQAGRDLRSSTADALVFTTARGRPQSRRNALRAVHAAGDAAGLNGDGREPVGLHDLRHSFVAIALASGASAARGRGARAAREPTVTAAVYAGLTERRPRAARRQAGRGVRALNPCPQCPQDTVRSGRAAVQRLIAEPLHTGGFSARARTGAHAWRDSTSWGSLVRAQYRPFPGAQRSRFSHG